MALVKATSEAIGLTQLAEGWGMSLKAAVFVDSSAALAVTQRKGCGKLRHVRIGHLWIQQLTEDQEVLFKKVPGSENPADAMTKNLTGSRLHELVSLLSQRFCAGMAEAQLGLNLLEFHSLGTTA